MFSERHRFEQEIKRTDSVETIQSFNKYIGSEKSSGYFDINRNRRWAYGCVLARQPNIDSTKKECAAHKDIYPQGSAGIRAKARKGANQKVSLVNEFHLII